MTKLEVKNLSIAFEEKLFDDLSVEFNSGDWVTLEGKSGTGKSTFLKALARLQKIDSGSVFLDDKNMNDYGISEYRQQVSYAVQSAELFGDTVRDNLDLPFEIRGLKPDEKKQLAGLTSVDLPKDFIDKPIADLSGGQRQRVGLLRNMLFPQKVLLLDEISAGLDDQTKKIIWKKIDQVHKKEKNIVLSITHDETELKNASKVLEFKNGKVKFK